MFVMLTVFLITALIVALVLAVAIYWSGLSPAERGAFGDAFRAKAHTLVVLFTLVALPAALLLALPAWVPRWLLGLFGLSLWGLFVVVYWDRRVVPAPVLTSTPPAPLLPGLAPVPVMPLPPIPDGDVLKTFRWTFTPHDGQPVEMQLEVALSSERYRAARAQPRLPVGQWAHYATAEMPELDALAAEFQRLHLGREWSTLEQASNVLSFTQACIRYAVDAETTPAGEWPRYPIETLMDETGDCEDDVILAAAVLKRLGFEVALLYYPDHCALGVAGADGLPGDYITDPRTGLKYFYGETTAEGWHLGEVPADYRGCRPYKIESVRRVVSERHG
jgi:predicted transglutaminase-like cysteine proteinase